MASRGRGVIRQLPPHLSDLLYKLSETGRSFIKLYERKEERMQAIASELGEISKEVNETLKGTNTGRMIGAVFGGLGLAAGVAAAFLAGGSLAAEGAAKMAILGGTLALGGGATVITANVAKAVTEKISIENVEKLGKEFMTIVELLKDVLKEIKAVSEELEQKSSSLMTTTRVQANISLLTTEHFQQLLRQTGELTEKSKAVLDVTLTTLRGMRELLNFIINITRITPTPEEDAKFRKCITGSALQCEKTVHEFAKVRSMLKDFEEI